MALPNPPNPKPLKPQTATWEFFVEGILFHPYMKAREVREINDIWQLPHREAHGVVFTVGRLPGHVESGFMQGP